MCLTSTGMNPTEYMGGFAAAIHSFRLSAGSSCPEEEAAKSAASVMVDVPKFTGPSVAEELKGATASAGLETGVGTATSVPPEEPMGEGTLERHN